MAAAEFTPFVQVGELGKIIENLLKKLKKTDEVTLFIPFYEAILKNNSEISKEKKVLKKVGEKLLSGKLFSYWKTNHLGLEVILVQNNYFFGNRNYIYGYDDDFKRFAFFCRAVASFIKDLNYDILHIHDWHTALIPFFLAQNKSNLNTVFTIHNIRFQGICSNYFLGELGINHSVAKCKEPLNFLKIGLLSSDKVTTNSVFYLREIEQNYEMTNGLSHLINREKAKFSAIVPGIDESFDPENDPLIPTFFSSNDISGKVICKTFLQKELKLPVHTEIPIMIIPSTNISNNEIFLLNSIISYLARMEIQIIIIGYGLSDFEETIRESALRSNCKVTSVEDNSVNLRKVFSGADIFLDIFPNCLNDHLIKISLKYGVLPIVLNESPDLKIEKNRFRIFNFTSKDLINTIKYVTNRYYQMEMWNDNLKKAMKYDFSWDKTAKEYRTLYKELLAKS